jgi:hypothetical protein
MSETNTIKCPEHVTVRGVNIPLSEANHERALYSFNSGNCPSFRVWYWPAHAHSSWFVAICVDRGHMTAEYTASRGSLDEVCDALCDGMPAGDWALIGAFLRSCVDAAWAEAAQ